MRRNLFHAIALAAALLVCSRAHAWLLYPDDDDPGRMVVEIEKPYGDLVEFRFLPPPYNRVFQPAEGPAPLIFLWAYRREAVGSAFLEMGEDGQARIEFEFRARLLAEGQRLGAAAVLVGKDGTPLHTFYVRADTIAVAFDDDDEVRRVSLALDRPPQWWGDVAAISFFNMNYHPMQKLDDEGVWAAMRQAVERFTKGQGTQQRG